MSSVKSQMEMMLSSIYWVLRAKCAYEKRTFSNENGNGNFI